MKLVLSWEAPPNATSTEQWQSISADGAPPGVYTPNMSAEDARKWKAKLVGKTTDNPRVEIRKTTGNGIQVLIVVSRNEIHLSMNGKAEFNTGEFWELENAIIEAQDALDGLKS
jgi:hypothetical protein